MNFARTLNLIIFADNKQSNRLMKKIFHFVICILLVQSVGAQTLVSIADPTSWSYQQMQQYVGQTVSFDCDFVVCNNYYYQSGTYTIAPRRIYSPTNQQLPASSEYKQMLIDDLYAQVTLSGISSYHRMGEHIKGLKVRVDAANSWTAVAEPQFQYNSRTDIVAPPTVDMRGEHNLLVCAFNLEYYLVENLGSGSMGPRTKELQERQHNKIMSVISRINADIFGFVEIEEGQKALDKIAQSLTAATGRRYTYINDGGKANGTYTKAGYVYCMETVVPYGALRENGAYLSDRHKIQAFDHLATGERFLFSLNHFKAKSGTGTGINEDKGDGQGIYNGQRKIEAQSVLSSYQTNKSYYGDDDILIMGDLNAYAMEDPITILREGGMTDLHRFFHADSSYSYVFRGQAGYLDHALCNSTLLPQITGMAAWHVNSDEDDRFTYNGSAYDGTMYRCSDHDPVLVGLLLGGKMNGNGNESYDMCDITLTDGHINITNAASGYYRISTMQGLVIEEAHIAGDDILSQTALRSGMYFVNVYVEGRIKQFKIMVCN